MRRRGVERLVAPLDRLGDLSHVTLLSCQAYALSGALPLEVCRNAALRAIEIAADIVFKATKVDGIYSSDPMKDPSAVKFDSLTFDSAIEQNIKVMDTAAFALCRDNNIKICVFSMLEDNYSLANIIKGQAIGTTVSQTGE